MFAAAEQGIDTKLLRGLVEYSDFHRTDIPPKGPAIIHYGLHCHVNEYHFTKYDYPNFDVCSPSNAALALSTSRAWRIRKY